MIISKQAGMPAPIAPDGSAPFKHAPRGAHVVCHDRVTLRGRWIAPQETRIGKVAESNIDMLHDGYVQ